MHSHTKMCTHAYIQWQMHVHEHTCTHIHTHLHTLTHAQDNKYTQHAHQHVVYCEAKAKICSFSMVMYWSELMTNWWIYQQLHLTLHICSKCHQVQITVISYQSSSYLFAWNRTQVCLTWNFVIYFKAHCQSLSWNQYTKLWLFRFAY